MNIEDLKEAICKYGNIEIIKEGVVFTLLLTGHKLSRFSVYTNIMSLVIEYTKAKYPIIEAIKNDDTFFCIVLRP